MKNYVIAPQIKSSLLYEMLQEVLGNNNVQYVEDDKNIPDMKKSRIIIAAELDEAGFYTPVAKIISALKSKGNNSLMMSKAILLIYSPNELNTKSAAKNIIFQCNMMGCSFIGHPIVEATGTLANFKTWQKTINFSLKEICLMQCKKLGERFFNDNNPTFKNPTLLALHASSSSTSNTLALWRMTEKNLSSKWNIIEQHVENGDIKDCAGCSFNTCIHYGKQRSCFYGGVMVEEIYPSIEKADSLLWICPNYNDNVSANIMAVINRITALYRQLSFKDKYVFSIIVSGNSGSDSVAKQLIGALNVNKGFRLPPYFCLMATANDPGSIYKIPDIEKLARFFAVNVMESIIV